MHPKEIPALPFALDADSAARWLDGLPIRQIRECCRLFFPVLQSMNLYPMAPRIRFEILEQCRPTVLGLARDLLPHFIGRPLPLDVRTRKIASLCPRFHLEAAQGYRQLAQAQAVEAIFSEPERLRIIQRGLEHLAEGQLRSAQMYETAPSTLWSSAVALYQCAMNQGLLDAGKHNPAETPRAVFARILLFRLAVPGRLDQCDMQRLFDLLALHVESTQSRAGEAPSRMIFLWDGHDPGGLTPTSAVIPFDPKWQVLTVDGVLSGLPGALRELGRMDDDSLTRVLPRLGARLPCPDRPASRTADLDVSFPGIMAMLKQVDARRAKGHRAGFWSGATQFELAPREDTTGWAELPPDAAADSRWGPVAGKRSAVVQLTERPGFYLLDSGGRTFRAGDIISLNTSDEWIQVGIVRGGQVRDGRFWNSFEALGNDPRLVKLRGGRQDTGMANGLLFETTAGFSEVSVLAPSGKWRIGDPVSISSSESTKTFHIAQLLETGSGFTHMVLSRDEPDAASDDSGDSLTQTSSA